MLDDSRMEAQYDSMASLNPPARLTESAFRTPRRGLIVSLGVLLVFVSTILAATAGDATVAISFTDVLSDEEISAILRDSGARPLAFYVQAADLHGTFTVRPGSGSDDAIAETRARFLLMQQKSFGGLAQESRDLLAEFPWARFQDSLQARKQAQNLLDRITLDREIIRSIENNEPLIFGVKVLIERSSRAALAADPRIVDIIDASGVAGRDRGMGSRLVRPSKRHIEVKATRSLSAAELYSALGVEARRDLP
jgi:hypothetical protein